MRASVNKYVWYPVQENYILNPTTVPAKNEKIMIKHKQGSIEEEAYFLPFDGVRFVVKTKNSRKLVVDSGHQWRRV